MRACYRRVPRRATSSPRRRTDPGEKPLHAREVLQVVAAEEMDEGLQGDLAVPLELRRPPWLVVLDPPDLLHGGLARGTECGEHFVRIGRGVAALLRQRIPVDRFEEGLRLFDRAAEAD